jgi:hypothetical protein
MLMPGDYGSNDKRASFSAILKSAAGNDWYQLTRFWTTRRPLGGDPSGLLHLFFELTNEPGAPGLAAVARPGEETHSRRPLKTTSPNAGVVVAASADAAASILPGSKQAGGAPFAIILSQGVLALSARVGFPICVFHRIGSA